MTIDTLRPSRLAVVFLVFLLAGCSIPYGVSVSADSIPSLRDATEDAHVIVLGVVTEVMPARWTTLNGQRPALLIPLLPSPYTIYRPATIRVTQFLKGEDLVSKEGTADHLVVALRGGTVGEDMIDRQPAYPVSEGDEVVVFLAPYLRPELDEYVQMNPEVPDLAIIERYIVEDGQARVLDLAEGTGEELIPIQELSETIRQILAN